MYTDVGQAETYWQTLTSASNVGPCASAFSNGVKHFVCSLYNGLYSTVWSRVFIRLEAREARFQSNLRFTSKRSLTAFTRSGITPPKVNRFGWNLHGALWVHPRGLALTDFERDPRSSERWRARRNFIFFCPISNTRFYRFPVGRISRYMNTTRRSVSRRILSEQNFEKFPVRGRFSTKPQKFENFCDFRPP